MEIPVKKPIDGRLQSSPTDSDKTVPQDRSNPSWNGSVQTSGPLGQAQQQVVRISLLESHHRHHRHGRHGHPSPSAAPTSTLASATSALTALYEIPDEGAVANTNTSMQKPGRKRRFRYDLLRSTATDCNRGGESHRTGIVRVPPLRRLHTDLSVYEVPVVELQSMLILQSIYHLSSTTLCNRPNNSPSPAPSTSASPPSPPAAPTSTPASASSAVTAVSEMPNEDAVMYLQWDQTASSNVVQRG
ncbi:hypothetical protein BYT27DRAFT_7263902 [Phlegmacium glaucopus]|nr:hypothetical protein BYT27DRAFT_7263902 [Phlegmacium glaucopus]